MPRPWDSSRSWRDVRVRVLVRDPSRSASPGQICGRPAMGGARRARAGTTPDPRVGVDRSRNPPQARRGSAGSRAEDWRGDPEDSRTPVLRASVGGGLLSLQNGPRRKALRHLVLRRWGSAERLRAPGTAVVYGIIVAESAGRAGDRLGARP